MSDLRPRTNRSNTGNGDASTIARHGQLKRRNPFGTVAKILAAALAVVLVSGVSVAAIAAWDVTTSVHKSVTLVDAKGKAIRADVQCGRARSAG